MCIIQTGLQSKPSIYRYLSINKVYFDKTLLFYWQIAVTWIPFNFTFILILCSYIQIWTAILYPLCCLKSNSEIDLEFKRHSQLNYESHTTHKQIF